MVAVLPLGVLACGASRQGATVTQTVTQTAVPAASTPSETSSEAESRGSGRKIRVPNVVGKDHQLAQDTMQAAGLYNLAEEDATGQGRALIYDRNWTVVSQSPRPGTLVHEDQTITLRSKKDGE
jgi:beta-lactam-binding protein with PASTA domain